MPDQEVTSGSRGQALAWLALTTLLVPAAAGCGSEETASEPRAGVSIDRSLCTMRSTRRSTRTWTDPNDPFDTQRQASTG